MQTYDINLVREQVQPYHRRRRHFLLALVYLAVFGLVAVLATTQATRRLADAFHHQRTTAMLEWDFHKSYSGVGDMLTHAGTVFKNLNQADRRLSVIRSSIKDRVRLAPLLYGLQAPLPYNVHIVALELDQKKKELVFDIVLPAESNQGEQGTRAWIQAWSGDPLLSDTLKDIKPSVSKRQKIDGVAVYVLRFTAGFSGGSS